MGGIWKLCYGTLSLGDCLAGELVWQGRTRLAGELVWQGNSFGRETRFAGNSTKTFIFITVMKHITYNTKVGEIILFCDLRNVSQRYS